MENTLIEAIVRAEEGNNYLYAPLNTQGFFYDESEVEVLTEGVGAKEGYLLFCSETRAAWKMESYVSYEWKQVRAELLIVEINWENFGERFIRSEDDN